MLGMTLSHYRITDKLGQGGMGEVYRAEDTTLSRHVAIKVLPDAFASDPERLARFEREAKLLASLNHPNIASIYGLEQADGKRFLVLESALMDPAHTPTGRIAAVAKDGNLDQEKLALLMRTQSEPEANIVKGLLEESGIDCTLVTQVPRGLYPFTVDGLAAIQIKVLASDLETAQTVLHDYENAPCPEPGDHSEGE